MEACVLNYWMQGHSLPYYWITKAAIVICLVQQKVLTWMCWSWILYDRSARVLNCDVHMATDRDSKICAKKILKTKSLVERALCIGQIAASTSPPGIYPGRFIPLSSRRGGNLIIRVFMEVGNFDPHAQGDGVFELNPPSDFVLVVSFCC